MKAVTSSTKIDNEVVAIDPTLLFQRISLNIENKSDMRKFLQYELAPYPLPLFDEGGMRKGRKSSFYDNFSKITELPRNEQDYYVIDGGFLLHKVRWDTNNSIEFIVQHYVNYAINNYSRNCTIVFDGYPDGLSTKSTKAAERSRRENKNLGREIEFNRQTVISISQDKFLSKDKNKKNLITLLCEQFKKENCTTLVAEEDADFLIVTTAEKCSLTWRTWIVGE